MRESIRFNGSVVCCPQFAFFYSVLVAWVLLLAGPSRAATLPAPDQSGVPHILVVMMENRSFDHIMGWLPGADGRQSGLSYPDRSGTAHATYPLAPDFQGCGHP